ncbi:restriction endonuclease [Cellulosimicrobium sp. Marseille-Q8652]
MAKWKEYQEESAAFFRTLGLEAETDKHLEGVRGGHDIDVVVRSRRAGLDQLWVVECKHWKRRVSKLHVSALAEIVRNVGADRGLLLSEKGFQAGAGQVAYRSNITLTSLAALREDSDDERLALRLADHRLHLGHLRERLSKIGHTEKRGQGFSRSYRKPSAANWDFLQLHAAAAIAEDGLRRAEMGRWPAPYAWDFASGKPRRAQGMATFIDGFAAALDELETGLVAFEAANA